jgi:hypothetical protein
MNYSKSQADLNEPTVINAFGLVEITITLCESKDGFEIKVLTEKLVKD